MKTGREAGAGAFAFLEVNDGSCFANIQVGGGCFFLCVSERVKGEVGSGEGSEIWIWEGEEASGSSTTG